MSSGPEVLLDSEHVRVRIMTLNAREATAWHYHTEVTDQMLCLDGRVAVECRSPQERFELVNGQHCKVEVGRVHRVVNLTDEIAKYLLVQGVGQYDFKEVD